MKRKLNNISTPSPYDLSVFSRKKKRVKKSSASPYDLSEIDMEERREWIRKNRSRL